MKNSIHLTIISVFYFLTAIILVAISLTYLFASNWLKVQYTDSTFIQNMDASVFAIWGVVLLLIAGLEFFFAYKLYKGSKIAKNIALVISIIGIIWAVAGLFVYRGFENIIFIIIHSYFIWTLKNK